MTDPTPTIASLDGSTFLSLVSLARSNDPRMDEARFGIVGPDLKAESVVDAYQLDTLFGALRALLAGDVQCATFGLGELTFRRGVGSEIHVELGGGPYVGGAERTWVCTFAAASRQIASFVEAMEETWRATPAV